MSYTLLSAAVMSYELAHLPAGPTVARALLTGLTADTATVLKLAGRQRPAASSRQAGAPPIPLHSLPGQVSATTTPQQLLTLLAQTRMDGPQALENLIRREILGPDSPSAGEVGEQQRAEAADALVQEVLEAWAVVAGPAEDLPRPSTPRCDVDATALGPHGAAVVDLLDSLTATDTRSAWFAARPVHPDTWADAMHEACWAALLSGRVRAAAQAQLMGVLAFRATGFGAVQVASGAWTALSGVLQAVIVSDLLDTASKEALLSPAWAGTATG